jgi:hypothetical protein
MKSFFASMTSMTNYNTTGGGVKPPEESLLEEEP